MSRSVGRKGPIHGPSIEIAEATSLKIDLLSDQDSSEEDAAIACCSAVVIRISGRQLLVTNLHNFTGYHLWTRESLDPKGRRRPHRLRLWLPSGEELWTPRVLEIFTEPQYDSVAHRLWIMHPELQGDCDLAVLPLPAEVEIDGMWLPLDGLEMVSQGRANCPDGPAEPQERTRRYSPPAVSG